MRHRPGPQLLLMVATFFLVGCTGPATDDAGSDAGPTDDAGSDVLEADTGGVDGGPLPDDGGPLPDDGGPRPDVGVPTENIHHVRAGATGDGSGVDWANAYTELPDILIRGHVYYVAGGSYPGRTFDTPADGTMPIAILGATALAHGTDTGWNPAFDVSAAPAVWMDTVSFTSSHWVWDGVAGGGLSLRFEDYGFAFATLSFPLRVYNTSEAISDVTIAHVAAVAPEGDLEKWFLSTDNSTRSVHRVTVRHCYGDGWGNFAWMTSDGLDMDGWLFEHNVIRNGFSSAANHGEDINNNYGYVDDLTVRYNWFLDRSSGTGVIVVLNGPAGHYDIYGNVFQGCRSGDGIIAGVHHPLDASIYNNTFVDCQAPWSDLNDGRVVAGELASSTTFRNNIICDQAANMALGAENRSHNAYYGTRRTPTGEVGLVTGTACPVVSSAAGDYRLSAATEPGASLPAPYDVDPDGRTRGADGTWDRGAYEY